MQQDDDAMEGEAGRVTRREFVGMSVATAVVAGSGGLVEAVERGGMIYRTLGRTGEKVSLVGLGGAHIGRQADERESVRIIRSALDHGINFLDNCWDYNDGQSEIRMGKALADGYRAKAFLMTKIDGRDQKTAAKQLDESLKRLGTDHVDLLQLHEIIRDDDPDRIFAPGGAIEAVVAARKAGKARYLGFTGHKSPAIHRKMLDMARAHSFAFDTVQMPLNVMDAHYESFEKRILPVARERGLAVLGMKPLGDGKILGSGAVTATECLHYAMSLPVSVVITGCDSLPILEQAVAAVRSFQPMSERQVQALLARTAKAAEGGRYELYKTSGHFDSTSQHPEYLGGTAA